MGVTTEALEAWRSWVGRAEVRRETLDPGAVRRFAAAVGAELGVERIMPPLAHWGCFLPAPPASELGPDGHPRRGGLLPPVDLPRRMWAAGSIAFHRPLVLGREAELTSTVAEVTHRSGKTGDLVFVEVDHRLVQDGGPCVDERQTLVYRQMGAPLAAVAESEALAGEDEETWTPRTTDLFRFSAATFNGHRIHYDQAYTREVEGYPDLVVHGPLTATMLCGFSQRLAGRPVRRFDFRALAPLFVDQPVRLRAGPQEGEVEAVRCDGAVAMSARAGF